MTEKMFERARANELFEYQLTLTYGLEDGYVGISLETTGVETMPIEEGIPSSPVDVQDGSETISQGFPSREEFSITVMGLVEAESTFRETGDISVVDKAIGEVERMIAMNPDERYLGLLQQVLSRLLSVRRMSSGQVGGTTNSPGWY